MFMQSVTNIRCIHAHENYCKFGNEPTRGLVVRLDQYEKQLEFMKKAVIRYETQIQFLREILATYVNE